MTIVPPKIAAATLAAAALAGPLAGSALAGPPASHASAATAVIATEQRAAPVSSYGGAIARPWGEADLTVSRRPRRRAPSSAPR